MRFCRDFGSAIGAVVCWTLIASLPAKAHAVLSDSTPREAQLVTSHDVPIELRFNCRIDAKRSRVLVIGPDLRSAVLPLVEAARSGRRARPSRRSAAGRLSAALASAQRRRPYHARRHLLSRDALTRCSSSSRFTGFSACCCVARSRPRNRSAPAASAFFCWSCPGSARRARPSPPACGPSSSGARWRSSSSSRSTPPLCP